MTDRVQVHRRDGRFEVTGVEGLSRQQRREHAELAREGVRALGDMTTAIGAQFDQAGAALLGGTMKAAAMCQVGPIAPMTPEMAAAALRDMQLALDRLKAAALQPFRLHLEALEALLAALEGRRIPAAN